MKYKFISMVIASFFISSMTSCGHALDLDMTVEDDIRKNYNPTQLINDVGIENHALNKNIEADKTVTDSNLPELPNISKQNIPKKYSDIKGNTIVPTKTIIYKGGNIKVRKGTTFDVTSNVAIADWQIKGTKVKFTTKKNTYGKYYTIPVGTVFYGEIAESHPPQITCNGGLVVIQVYSMLYKGQTIPINAYITRANDKKIFFNNIKGERNYLKTLWTKGNWGRTLFNKMFNLTLSLGAEGSTAVLSPFPITYGTICLGANALASPICAFFSKGGRVSIPAGSPFRIKIVEDVMID